MKRRVAITGVGLVSPVGSTISHFWYSLSHGCSGVGPITRYDASGFPVRIAAEVRGFSLAKYTDASPVFIGHDGCPVRLDLRTQYALAASEMAVRDAALDASPAWRDASLYFGAGEGHNDIELLWRMVAPWASADTGAL